MTGERSRLAGDLVGRVLLGRYRLVRELAKGGMGVVYLARSEGAVGFVKPVVVKLVLPEHAEDSRFVGMFVREAQILSQLRHPSVVDVLEFGEQDGAYVLVLEYVRGYHIGQWMRYLQKTSREAPPEILIQVVIDVLEALHHAHDQVHPDGTPMQIVHRDVSPSNILLDEDGRGRLLDFGVARMRGGAHDEKTQFQGFMGKLPYTAPEMFEGGDASPRSDLYACAVVLHELLLERNVFRADNQAATMHRVIHHVPEPVEPVSTAIPTGLDAVLARALAKSPGERFADARAFAAALRMLQREQESDIRARLADLLRTDFGREMADLLDIESLAERDEAWRRLSERPPRAGEAREVEDPSGARATLRKPLSPDSRGGKAPDEVTPHAETFVGRRPRRPTPRPQQISLPAPPARAAVVTFEPAPASIGGIAPALRGGATSIARAEVADQVAPSAAVAAPPPAAAAPPPVAAAPPRTATPGSRGVVIGLAAVAALAIAAIALSLRSAPVPAAAPPTPQIRVVATPNARAPERVPAIGGAAAEPNVVGAPQPDPRSDPERDQAEGPHARVASDRREAHPKRASEPNLLTLTRTFRKQEPKLEACFEQHPSPEFAQATVQLEFDLDAAGKLRRVALDPRGLGSTPLGACLLRIARSTAFPAQGQPVSFAIPVTTQRAGK